jgi:hypothetical protein
MTQGPTGIRHQDGKVTHTTESIKWALGKAIELLEREGLRDTALIVRDVAEGRCSGSEWRPIEIAPKNGNEILACTTNVGYSAAIVKWTTDFRRPAGYWLSGGIIPFIPPSYWMPLPEPPALHEI